MDIRDKKILYELEINCRQSNTKIAKKLKISKDVVNYRIKRLEEQGIIDGYRTVIDTYKLGYFIFRAYLKLQDTNKEIENEIIAFIKKKKEVFWFGSYGGRFNLGFGFWSKSHREFYDFWVEFLSKYRKYIQNEQLSTFVELIHFKRAYLLDFERDETKMERIGSEERIKYDDIDFRILSILAVDARVPLLEISSKTNLTPMAVKHRIRNLEKNGTIQGYKVLINYAKYGYEYYKVDIYLEDMKKIKELQTFCHMHPNIIYIDRTIGGTDMEFDLEVRNLAHFIEIMEEVKEKFKGAIRNYEYSSVLEIFKLLYFPA